MQNLELQIGKWGNSLGIRLPKHVLEALDLSVKDKIICTVKNGKVILKPVRKSKYILEELLEKIDAPSEEISWGKPEGEEVW